MNGSDKLKVVTVIQARTGSTRLPGKVLKDLHGKPLLLRMVERVKFANLSGTVVVATSTKAGDDAIEKLCKDDGIEIYRGSEEDLLDRHYRAGLKYDADAVVKIPSDCPLIDPLVIDKVLAVFLEKHDKYDFVSNLHPATYPDGNDVEVMSLNALESAWESADKKFEREHTTPYIWENPGLFRVCNVTMDGDVDYSFRLKWSIDHEEDYRFIRAVYDELYDNNPRFGVYDILELLERKPELAEINKKYAGEYWYKNHLDELENIKEYKNKLKGKDGELKVKGT